jgi:hypothetical protein
MRNSLKHDASFGSFHKLVILNVTGAVKQRLFAHASTHERERPAEANPTTCAPRVCLDGKS